MIMDSRILQISDSMFPVGGLAHSFGLETLAAEGRVGPENFEAYLGAMLAGQAGPCDLVFMLAAFREPEDAERLSKLYGCHKPVPELNAASLGMGRRMAKLGHRLTGDARLEMLAEKGVHHAIAFGAVAASMGIGEEDAAYGFLYNWLAGVASAAIRLMPLGHDAAQETIYRLGDDIRRAYLENRNKGPSDAWQFAPESEMAGMEHEKQFRRLFLS